MFTTHEDRISFLNFCAKEKKLKLTTSAYYLGLLEKNDPITKKKTDNYRAIELYNEWKNRNTKLVMTSAQDIADSQLEFNIMNNRINLIKDIIKSNLSNENKILFIEKSIK